MLRLFKIPARLLIKTQAINNESREKRIFTFLFFIIANTRANAQQKSDNLKRWYTAPASIWQEALPLGIGKLGVMVFGG